MNRPQMVPSSVDAVIMVIHIHTHLPWVEVGRYGPALASLLSAPTTGSLSITGGAQHPSYARTSAASPDSITVSAFVIASTAVSELAGSRSATAGTNGGSSLPV